MRFRRAAFAFVLALAGITGGVGLAPGPRAHAADSRAVVVVDTGSGVHRIVVSFGGTITGIQALALAGANPATSGYAGQGAAVCALYGVGHEASASDCLGTPADGRYWAYFRSPAGSGSWTYSRGCACTSVVHDGDVEGWRFGTGQSPPYSSFCAVAGCAPPPTPAPTPAPTAAPAAGGSGSPAPSVAGAEANAPPVGGGADGASGSGTGASGATTPSTAVASDGSAAPSSATPTTRASAHERSRRGSRDESAAGFGTNGGGDDGGSPWGVVGAVILVGALAFGGWWLRRNRVRRAGPPG